MRTPARNPCGTKVGEMLAKWAQNGPLCAARVAIEPMRIRPIIGRWSRSTRFRWRERRRASGPRATRPACEQWGSRASNAKVKD